MTRSSVYDRAAALEARAAVFEQLAAQLAEFRIGPAGREALDQMRKLHAEGLAELKQVYDDQGQLTRQATVLRAPNGRMLGERPVAQLLLQSGESIGLAVPKAMARRLAPGKIVELSPDHREVLDVTDLPPHYSVGTVSGVHSAAGETWIEIETEGGRRQEGLLPAWCFEPAEAKVGRKVSYHGRLVYAVRDSDSYEFIERNRSSRDFQVRPEEVYGADQRLLIGFLLTVLDTHVHPERYPARNRDNDGRILVFGPPGIGKSESIRAFVTVAREAVPTLHFFSLAANQFRGQFVGQTTERITETFRSANKLAAKGELVVLVIEEATTLLMDRSRSSHSLDSGVTLQATETLMARLDSAAGEGLHPNVVLIMTSNRVDLLDLACTGRLLSVPVFSFGPAEFEAVSRLWAAKKEPHVYAAAWEDGLQQAVRDALEVVIGHVLVGKDRREVRTRHVGNGRLARRAHVEAARHVDRSIRLAGGAEGALFPLVTPALLHTEIVRAAVAEFRPFDLDDCRSRFRDTDLCRAEREAALRDPAPLRFEDATIAERYDARPALGQLGEALAGQPEGLASRGAIADNPGGSFECASR